MRSIYPTYLLPPLTHSLSLPPPSLPPLSPHSLPPLTHSLSLPPPSPHSHPLLTSSLPSSSLPSLTPSLHSLPPLTHSLSFLLPPFLLPPLTHSLSLPPPLPHSLPLLTSSLPSLAPSPSSSLPSSSLPSLTPSPYLLPYLTHSLSLPLPSPPSSLSFLLPPSVCVPIPNVNGACVVVPCSHPVRGPFSRIRTVVAFHAICSVVSASSWPPLVAGVSSHLLPGLASSEVCLSPPALLLTLPLLPLTLLLLLALSFS